jgi:glycosyltransferase WbpL
VTASQAIILVAFAVAVLSVALTGFVRRYALKTGLLDQPNARSSHVQPTPRGGGIGIVVASMLGAVVLSWLGFIETRLAAALLVGGAMIAGVGFIDDRKGVPALVRLVIHVAAAAIAVILIRGVPALDLGPAHYDLGLAGSVLAVVCLVWTINLFNFMDGIDGIAGSEAVFVTFAAAALMTFSQGFSGPAAMSLAIGAAASGFLLWNWPPARIFLGDVGSGYLGYAIGLVALAAAKQGELQAIPSLILGGIFFVDATLTLVRRLARGESAHQPHRTHAYQWLAVRWASHLRVTLLVTIVNVFWLLPFAYWATVRTEYALWSLLALVPIVIGCFFIGSGAAEARVSERSRRTFY